MEIHVPHDRGFPFTVFYGCELRVAMYRGSLCCGSVSEQEIGFTYLVNSSKPSGCCKHRQVDNEIYGIFILHFIFFIRFAKSTLIISLHSLNRLVFLMQAHCVLCEQ